MMRIVSYDFAAIAAMMRTSEYRRRMTDSVEIVRNADASMCSGRYMDAIDVQCFLSSLRANDLVHLDADRKSEMVDRLVQRFQMREPSGELCVCLSRSRWWIPLPTGHRDGNLPG
jgi:hypothetical protein